MPCSFFMQGIFGKWLILLQLHSTLVKQQVTCADTCVYRPFILVESVSEAKAVKFALS